MSTATAVRNALAALAATATGLTAHLDPDYALEGGNLPALAIQSGGQKEDEEYSTFLATCYRAQFSVAVLAAAASDPGAAVETYAGQVRAAVLADPTLGGAALHTRYVGDADPDFDLGDCAQLRSIFDVIFS